MGHPTLQEVLVAARAVLYAVTFLVLWTWIALSAREVDSRLPFELSEWFQPLGWVVASFGAIVAALCVAAFATVGRGTPAPFDPPRRFVATGPYRYVRNPMYIGAFFMLLGLGLALRSPSMLGLSLAFLLLAHVFVMVHEEASLARRFGESYTLYRESVSRWLPKRPPSNASRSVG